MEHVHKPLYRYVLRDALLITWRNKFLWLLGFFVALLGTGGVWEVVIKGVDRTALKALWGGGRIPDLLSAMTKLRDFVLKSASIKPVFEFILVVALFLVILAIYFLVASAAMTAMVLAVKKLMKRERANLSECLYQSQQHLAHVFSINVLAKILTSLFIAASALPLGSLILGNRIAFGFIYIVSFVVLISLGLVVSFLSIYAVCSSVLEKRHIFHALARAWQIGAANAVISIEMALILFFLNIALSFVLVAALVTIGGLFGFVLTLLAGAKISALFWSVLALGILVFIAALVLTGSFFGAFQLVSWTILYTKLARGGVAAKIVRLAARFPRLLRLRKM
jgi:hypothetical protein